jgi:glutamate synthase (NADPH/NADH) small chain
MPERFPELKPALTHAEAVTEAARCLYCYDAPCTRACPTHIDVPAFIKKIGTGNLRGSARTIFDANVLGASCARVCPTEVLCEGACVMNDQGGKPIDIGRLQRHATDWAMQHGAKLWPAPAAPARGGVAVIGAGPAGLACAAELRALGHRVVVFEAHDQPGGLNAFGVAEYKMTQAFAQAEVRYVLDRGVELRVRTRVGKDVSFADLEGEFDAVFLGVGLGEGRRLGIPGEELPGVCDALDLIARLKTHPAETAAPGKRVVVVGGGNTAIDAVTQSLQLGAEEVHMAYRRGPADMSAYAHEQALARRMGVRFVYFAQPVRIHGAGRVESIEFARVSDQMKPVPGGEFRIACDAVVRAVGQSPHAELARAIAGIKLDGNRMRVNPDTLQTDNPRYFAGGDCQNGGAEVVNAVAEGKRAAQGIHSWLETQHRHG